VSFIDTDFDGEPDVVQLDMTVAQEFEYAAPLTP
jgi:hypothetical protein